MPPYAASRLRNLEAAEKIAAIGVKHAIQEINLKAAKKIAAIGVKRAIQQIYRNNPCRKGERHQPKDGNCKVPCHRPSRRNKSGNCSKPRVSKKRSSVSRLAALSYQSGSQDNFKASPYKKK
jgi:hypothetical protein